MPADAPSPDTPSAIQDPDGLLRRIEELIPLLEDSELRTDILIGRDRLRISLGEGAEDAGVRAARELEILRQVLRDYGNTARRHHGGATLQDVLAPEGKGAFDQRKELASFLERANPKDFAELIEVLRLFARERGLNVVVDTSAAERTPVETNSTAHSIEIAGVLYAVAIRNGNLQIFEQINGQGTRRWVLAVDTVTLPALAQEVLKTCPTDAASLIVALKALAGERGFVFDPPAPRDQVEIKLNAKGPPVGAFVFQIGSQDYALVLKGNKLELFSKDAEFWGPVYDRSGS